MAIFSRVVRWGLVFALMLSVAPRGQAADPAEAGGPTPAKEGLLSRWLEVEKMIFSIRYRSVFDSFNTHEYDQWTQKSLVSGQFKFDREGKYAIEFRASSGHYFDWAYADFAGSGATEAFTNAQRRFSPSMRQELDGSERAKDPGGLLNDETRSGGWAFYVRDLSFVARPIVGLKIEYGGIPINHGVGTEMTTYDDDGYMEGGRVSLLSPAHFYFDELSATYGYVGDAFDPNFFNSGPRFKQSNYHQFLARKRINDRLEFSLDYTVESGRTAREAVLVRIPEMKVTDTVRVELYQRPTTKSYDGVLFAPGYGYAVTGSKTIAKRVRLEAGVADIDHDYSVYGNRTALLDVFGFSLNGNQTGQGRRFFVKPAISITPYLALFGYYSRTFAYDNAAPGNFIWNKETMNFGLTLDLKKLLLERFQLVN